MPPSCAPSVYAVAWPVSQLPSGQSHLPPTAQSHKIPSQHAHMHTIWAYLDLISFKLTVTTGVMFDNKRRISAMLIKATFPALAIHIPSLGDTWRQAREVA